MQLEQQLSVMTRAEKWRVMELIWADLSSQPDAVESPAWHEEALLESQRAHETGKARFSDWGEAKERIRHQTTGLA